MPRPSLSLTTFTVQIKALSYLETGLEEASSRRGRFSWVHGSVTAGLLRGDGGGVAAAGLSRVLISFLSALWVPAPHGLAGESGGGLAGELVASWQRWWPGAGLTRSPSGRPPAAGVLLTGGQHVLLLPLRPGVLLCSGQTAAGGAPQSSGCFQPFRQRPPRG